MGFGAHVELSGGDFDTVLFSKSVYDVEVKVLIRAGEGDGEAEAGRERHEFLTGVVFVQVAAGTVFPVLLDEVAAVAGGVDHEISALTVYASFKYRFKGCEVSVVAGEAQIINEEYELQRQTAGSAGT